MSGNETAVSSAAIVAQPSLLANRTPTKGCPHTDRDCAIAHGQILADCRASSIADDTGVKSGFTLIELLVVVSIIAVLAAMMLPSISLVKESSKAMRCGSNMRQLGIAASSYSHDWEGAMVPTALAGTPWFGALQTYVDDQAGSGSKLVNGCPSFKNPMNAWCKGFTKSNYLLQFAREPSKSKSDHDSVGSTDSDGIVGRVIFWSELHHPAERLLLGDGNDWYAQKGGWQLVGNRHGKYGNFLFCDLHVEHRDGSKARRGVTLP
ncbi:MAG: type II secretion system protein [Planctomycetes bacterium]|nr:type II secretion system protein [Planctomycetota bacterium]